MAFSIIFVVRRSRVGALTVQCRAIEAGYGRKKMNFLALMLRIQNV